MRQNLIIALLSVACTLLAVNLYVSLNGTYGHPAAFGQGTGEPTSSVAIAAVQGTTNEPWVFLYDVSTQRLACYKNANQGLDFKGLRQLTWDLRLEELDPGWAAKGRIPVSQVRKALEKMGSR